MRGTLLKLAVILLVMMTVVSYPACSRAKPASTPTGTPSPAASDQQRKPASGPSASPKSTAPQVVTSAVSQVKTTKGSGNVSVLIDANLFFGTSGQIKKVNIKEGDRVTKGQELAKLDTINLEININQNKVALDQAKLAQTQAQSAVASAQLTFDKTQGVVNIKDQIINTEWQIKIATMRMQEALSFADDGGAGYWRQIIGYAQKDLVNLKKTLADLLTQPQYVGAVTYDILGQKYDTLTVQDMRMKQLAIDIAQQTLEKSQDSINQAQRNLDLAQQQLNQATIIAPFDGIIATVNIKEGDIIPAPAQMQRAPIYLVDLTAMQIKIGINELDIPKIKPGQKATIKVDALPGVKLEGKVTEIATLPTVQGGIVDYTVTVFFLVPADTEIKVGMNGTGEITLN